ncbi:hypothetical protein, partial [Escherichia coli]|uniref:hypothetical protein n=1 Tax=Escherichia coli TaxID=562 RepID=UPI001BAF4712
YVKEHGIEIIPDIISILLHFSHTLLLQVIYKASASNVLNDLISYKSKGKNDLLKRFVLQLIIINNLIFEHHIG